MIIGLGRLKNISFSGLFSPQQTRGKVKAANKKGVRDFSRTV